MKILLKYLLSAILIPAILFTSCSRNDSEVFNMIPETAMLVVSIQPGKLLEKGKLQEIEMVKEEAAKNEISKKLLEDPESSGIEMNAYSTFFVFNNNGQYSCALLPLKSKSDFEIFLDKVKLEGEFESETSSINSFTTQYMDDLLIVYDKSTVLILSSNNKSPKEDIYEAARSIVEIEKENILKTDKDFNNFLSKQKDISLWFSTNNIDGIPLTDNMGGSLDLVGGIKNNYGHVFADFQKGNMKIITNLRINKSLQSTIDKYNFLDENAIKDILKYLPSENLLFVGNNNVDPEKIFDLLKFVNRDFSKTIENMSSLLGFESEDLKNIFSGEIAFSINGIPMPPIETKDIQISSDAIPSIVFANRINDNKAFREFLELAKDHAELQDKDGYYEVLNKGIPVYLAVVKDDLILSNNENIISEIIEKGVAKENVLNSVHRDVLSSNPVCFYLNLDESTYTEEMQEFFTKKMNDKMEKGMNTFGSSLKSLSVSANIEEWEFRMDLKNDSENSLYSLLNQAKK